MLKSKFMKPSTVFFLLLLVLSLTGCSLLYDEKSLNSAEVDYLVGIEQSGRLKRELHFSSSEDKTVESDIEFIYEEDRLVGKIYNDYNWNEPYVLQKDEFIYKEGKLSQMIHYFRTGAPTSPLKVSKIYDYYYPNPDTKIEVIHDDDDNLRDSVIYIYEGDFLTVEKHINHLGTWGHSYEYNADGKLFKTTNLENGNVTVNYFDKNGLLDKSVLYEGDTERSVITYERENIGRDQVIIRCYLLHHHLNWTEPFLTSHKKFKGGKLVESVKYHPTFPGSEWWCNRYEYY